MMAVRTVPRTTARVTEESRSASSSRRCGSSGTSAAPSLAMGRPSRMMKKSTNSMTVNDSTVPTAPRKAMPPKGRELLEQVLAALDQPGLHVARADLQVLLQPVHDAADDRQLRQLLEAVPLLLPDPGLKPGREIRGLARERERERRHRTEEQERTSIVSANAEIEARPRNHLTMRACAGCSRKPMNSAQAIGPRKGSTIRYTRNATSARPATASSRW